MKHRKNLRTHKGTYISLLHNVPDGKACRHTGIETRAGAHIRSVGEDEGVFFTKSCDAYQTLPCSGKEVVFGRNDLVEVFK